ncbi:DUF3536 domain-containing protein [Ktedonospora formicarum]|uniref:Glycoside hydrolase family 57 N-terminal domain-containing protein n=1 Tax=Ktedonospora formicarum TaxID=2778364 RepID=A0A8J3HUW9_9CHLR|nr:DUF3536 domain-containing protein [Ktedonospora formicarum]GHO44492.1 hypothetical protein KSX_26550 [Ktedonospora formicarum]
MIEKTLPNGSISRSKLGSTYLCLHGHFYQPPRENPFTHEIPIESGAAPFLNYNEKITAECYRPNAEEGNFAEISYNLGPTLAAWLEAHEPDVHQLIIDADRKHMERYGVGNAMAQAYNHTILPLATTRDKHTQILWGLQDFRHRYGRDAHGMWLAETAIDLECLDILAQYGVTYTVLAPWQAATAIDPTEPYTVPLKSGRSMTVFFYNGPLSGGVSFDSASTSNADVFASSYLPGHLVREKIDNGEPQLILIATDGELYGHHKPWRDKFLSHLIQHGAPEEGFEICTLERYMLLQPPTKEVQLRVPSAWSCEHGVARWGTGCSCTEGESNWKPVLRRALSRLAERGDLLFEQYASEILEDPWAARNDYLALRNGWESEESFWTRHGKGGQRPSALLEYRAQRLLEAQYYQQYSFTSCAFFFEDLDRIEPRNGIAFARRAISLIWQAIDVDLQYDFLQDLLPARSWRTQKNGVDLYKELPAVEDGLLPPFPLHF